MEVSKPVPLNGTPGFFQSWLYVLWSANRDGFYSSPMGHVSINIPKKPLEKIAGIRNVRKNYSLVKIRGSQIQFAGLVEREHGGALSKGCCGSVISGNIAGVENTLKFKTMDSFNHPDALQVLEKEAQIYKRLEDLQGTVIPIFYGFFNLHGILMLALEDSGSPLPVSRLCEMESKVHEAIRQVNQRNVAHRDLEVRESRGVKVYPNILVTNSNEIRIIDFHMSKVVPDGQKGVDETAHVSNSKRQRIPED